MMIPRVVLQQTAARVAGSARSRVAFQCYRCSHSDAPRSDGDPEQDDLLFRILDHQPMPATAKPSSTAEQAHDSTHSKPKFSSKETRDFGKLLDALWSDSDDKKRAAQQQQQQQQKASDKKVKRLHSSIEKQLLDMVLRQSKPHKEAAPLPRSTLGAFYKGEKDKSRSGTRTAVRPDVELRKHDEGNRAIGSILDCKSSSQLLRCVVDRLERCNQQPALPVYYDRVIGRAIDHASTALRDPYLAVAIFEQAKATSIDSYIAGCTTRVYNALLTVRWKAWRDIHGMVNLVEEMMANGIGYDGDTRRIVQLAVSEIETDMDLASDDSKHGVGWSLDERRSANIMKALVGKWSIKS